jgi:signal transduction histidine kinase
MTALVRGRAWIIGPAIAVAAVLAGLWLRAVLEVRATDVAHLQQVIREGAEGVEWDFNHELKRAYDWFRIDPAAPRGRGDVEVRFAEKDAVWRSKAPATRLFRAWYLIGDDGRGEPSLRLLDPGSRRFVAAAWTAELTPVRAAIAARRSARMMIAARMPVALAPAWGPEIDRPAGLLVPIDRRAGDARGATTYALGLLDLDYVTGTLLPRYLGDDLGEARARAYDVEVRRAADPTSVLRTPAQAHAQADVEVPLFWLDSVHRGDVFVDNRDEDCRGLWVLRLTHRDGSIAAHVDRERRRDLILSGLVIVVLVASLGLLLWAAWRARRVARQQLVFVAGITHELRTPLAVIRSAAENLADGVVSEPAHVRRYGALLLAEGRRLSQMVEQAIDVAALETRSGAAPVEDYDLGALVTDLVAASPAGVSTAIAPALPSLRGDPAATRLVLRNLVENARKHAAGSPIAIQVDAVSSAAGPALRIELADRGPGIDADDLPHLFEPFYRGRRARDQQVPGSGLGLSVVKRLVQRQHGTITVRSQPGRGARFIVHLPRSAQP